MIEPTDEMRRAFYENSRGGSDAKAGLAAVLAIVARDRCMEAAGHASHPLARPARCLSISAGFPCSLAAGHEGWHTARLGAEVEVSW